LVWLLAQYSHAVIAQLHWYVRDGKCSVLINLDTAVEQGGGAVLVHCERRGRRGGSTQEAKTLRAKFPVLAAAAWFADRGQDAFRELKLHGLPSFVGVNQQTMQWAAIGAADPISFKSRLNSWLNQGDPETKQ
jgi:hypothetical protein